jgi:hypothetical protein
MKRIIAGRTYDTETARLITEYSHGYPGDTSYYRERLYSTPRNAFYLTCHGGVRSHYAYGYRDGQLRAGDDIIPLTDEEVLRWLEDHERTQEIEDLFGKQPDAGEATAVICFRVSPEVKGRVVQTAAKSGHDVQSWLEMVVAEALKHYEAK